MSQPRIDGLIGKLEKGYQKTRGYFENLTPEKWQQRVYPEPYWNAHNLLAHFVSAEQNLLALSQNVASNGPGAPEGIQIDDFNAQEQNRFQGWSTQDLIIALDQVHQQTIVWVHTLTDEQLEKKGRHPVLGEIRVEDMLTAIYGHQIMHLRDLLRLHRSGEKKA